MAHRDLLECYRRLISDGTVFECWGSETRYSITFEERASLAGISGPWTMCDYRTPSARRRAQTSLPLGSCRLRLSVGSRDGDSRVLLASLCYSEGPVEALLPVRFGGGESVDCESGTLLIGSEETIRGLNGPSQESARGHIDAELAANYRPSFSVAWYGMAENQDILVMDPGAGSGARFAFLALAADGCLSSLIIDCFGILQTERDFMD